MSKEKHDKPLFLDMPFKEALARYAQADPGEMEEPKKKKKKRRRATTPISESTKRALPSLDKT
jgi:hypothetical protein